MLPLLLPTLPPPDAASALRAAETVPAEIAPAPAESRPRPPDSLFPGPGRVSATVSSGLPFVAIGELAVGIGDRFAIGAIGGATPEVPGFGVRPRVVAFEAGRVRGVVVAPSLYYPSTSGGGSPWLLTRPAFVVEYGWRSGVRVGGGIGMVAASSVAELGGEKRRSTYGAKELEAGLWETVNATFSAPLSTRTSIFVETAIIFHGARLAGDEWVGVLPLMHAAGLTANLF